MSIINDLRLSEQQKEQRKEVIGVTDGVKIAGIAVGVVSLGLCYLFPYRLLHVLCVPVVYACYEVFTMASNLQGMYQSPVKEAQARLSKQHALNILMKGAPVFKAILAPITAEDFHKHIFL